MPVDLVMDDREGEMPSKSEVESARTSLEQVDIFIQGQRYGCLEGRGNN